MFFSSTPFMFLCLFVVVMGSLVSVSSSHWLGIWVGLELNLIGFLPILVYQSGTLGSESSVKYFIVQAIGSSLLMFGSLNLYSLCSSWEALSVSNEGVVGVWFFFIVIGLIVKMGVFPFHFWFPGVMVGLSWVSCFFLSTWQKFAPLMLFSSLLEVGVLYKLVYLFLVVASGSSLLGGIGGFNQTQIRSLLAYSSISHFGWMIFGLCFSEWVMKVYFFVYFFVTFCVFMSFWCFGSTSVKYMVSFLGCSVYLSGFIMSMFLSLGGLPPLVGFIVKLVVIMIGCEGPGVGFIFFLILGTVISLCYYLSLCFVLFLGGFNELYVGLGGFIGYLLVFIGCLNIFGGIIGMFLFSFLGSF